jgi:TetR/AcrR family transcriptional regulator
VTWVERAADRSPVVQRTRSRSAKQATVIVTAAERLMAEKGGSFTTHEVAKEAGVALQTLYRYFDSKDRLLLAVFEDMIAAQVERYAAAADELTDPVERLRVIVTASLEAQPAAPNPAHRFITAEYWRLSELFPDEMARATHPFVEMTERRLRDAVDAGSLRSDEPSQDAWLITKMVMAIFHQRAFAPDDPMVDQAKERLWAFVLAALSPTDH